MVGMKALYLTLSISVLSALTGCSSVPLKKAHLPSGANPATEFAQLEAEMRQGHNEQLSILSPEAFEEANDYFEQAKSLLKNNSDPVRTLESIAYAKGALQTAFDRALKVSPLLGQVTDSRKKALESGADTYTKSDFRRLDREVIRLTRQLEQGDNQATLDSIADRGEFQKRYSDLELQTLYLRYLGEARQDVEKLKSSGAARKAPSSFSRLESKLRMAEGNIAADRYNQTLLQTTQNELKVLAHDLQEEIKTKKRLPASEAN
jgi:hypothetical protein